MGRWKCYRCATVTVTDGPEDPGGGWGFKRFRAGLDVSCLGKRALSDTKEMGVCLRYCMDPVKSVWSL